MKDKKKSSRFPEKTEETILSCATQETKPDTVLPDADEELLENERFRILLREAYYTYEKEALMPEKPLDLSFLPEEAAKVLMEKNPELRMIRKKPGMEKMHRFLRRVAVCLLCVGLTGGLTWWMNSQSSYAAKFHLERMLYRLSGNYYSTDSDMDDHDDVISIQMEDPEDLDRAIRFMPELRIPSLPEDWSFQALTLSRTMRGKKEAKFLYNGQDGGTVTIEETVAGNDNNVESESAPGSRRIELSGEEVMLTQDPENGQSIVTFRLDSIRYRLSGDVREEILLSLAEELL